MLSIGKLAKATGSKVPTIRYYEEIGLLPEAERSAGNQRLYGPETLNRLRFIRHARALGFPLDAIRDLLSLATSPDHPCEAADEIAATQLVAVRSRIAQLRALEAELVRMLDHGAHDTIATCRVIDVLAHHELCESDHLAPEDLNHLGKV